MNTLNRTWHARTQAISFIGNDELGSKLDCNRGYLTRWLQRGWLRNAICLDRDTNRKAGIASIRDYRFFTK